MPSYRESVRKYMVQNSMIAMVEQQRAMAVQQGDMMDMLKSQMALFERQQTKISDLESQIKILASSVEAKTTALAAGSAVTNPKTDTDQKIVSNSSPNAPPLPGGVITDMRGSLLLSHSRTRPVSRLL